MPQDNWIANNLWNVPLFGESLLMKLPLGMQQTNQSSKEAGCLLSAERMPVLLGQLRATISDSGRIDLGDSLKRGCV